MLICYLCKKIRKKIHKNIKDLISFFIMMIRSLMFGLFQLIKNIFIEPEIILEFQWN
jgi:hypothetical protein